MHKYIDLTVEAYEENFEISFSSKGVFLNSIMAIHCSTLKGQTKSDVKGGVVKIFCFVGYKWMTPKWEDYRNPCKDLKFLICVLYISKLSYINYL